ncbi:hypothetical protein [Aliarcobacter vitoriensis]|nr:hypothetical protein [Aliarcobacter vitoriensis]
MFNIKRDRGKVQDIKVKDTLSNNNFLINSNKIEQIEPEYTYDEENGKIFITAPNKKRGNQYLEQLKKLGIIPKETIKEKDFVTNEEIKINTSFNLNIPELESNFSKSIVKSALALLSTHNNGSTLEYCKVAKDFLENDVNNCIEYNNYIFIENRPFATPLHCVYVFSNKNIINAYVELFGIARYIICLSNTYDGSDINLVYAINPQTAEEINPSELNFKKELTKTIHPGELHKELSDEILFDAEIDQIFIEYVRNLNTMKNSSDIKIIELYIRSYFLKKLKLKIKNSKYNNHLIEKLKYLTI